MTSSRIPSDLREVTASWLTEALHSKEVSSKASVTGYSAETIAGGNGFMNQVVRLGLRYDDDPVDLPRSVVLKLPSADPALRMLSNRLGSSQREFRFYQDVATQDVATGGQPANPSQLLRRGGRSNRGYGSAVGGRERPPG